MFGIINQHPALCCVGLYWLYSAIVGGMPEPSATAPAGYKWLYRSLHILAGNLSAVMAARYPNLIPTGSPALADPATTSETMPKV
jgi:hypothetical protein